MDWKMIIPIMPIGDDELVVETLFTSFERYEPTTLIITARFVDSAIKFNI